MSLPPERPPINPRSFDPRSDEPSAGELGAADALDAYLSELQAGLSPDRAKLTGQYPELAELLDSLAALDRISTSAQLPPTMPGLVIPPVAEPTGPLTVQSPVLFGMPADPSPAKPSPIVTIQAKSGPSKPSAPKPSAGKPAAGKDPLAWKPPSSKPPKPAPGPIVKLFVDGSDAPPEEVGADRLPTLPSPNKEEDRARVAMGLPEKIGKYHLHGELGRGGMGVVFKARQVDLDRWVALKMILGNQLASDDQRRRFEREARAAAGLSHPNIVHIHEVGELHGQPYFAMQYIAGRSLSDALKTGPWDEIEAARLTSVVARAVDYLHQQGVVHRDLKPSNILLDRCDRPYVTDFGLAKLLRSDDQGTQTGVIAGTPSYMSPEQAAGQNAKVGPSSDVYSLGAILYELLTGRPPFREDSPLDTLVQVLEGEPPAIRSLRPHAARDIEQICLRCLEKSDSARYPSAASLADDLDRFARGEPVEARPSSLFHALRRWSRREPALAVRLGTFVSISIILQTRFSNSLDVVSAQAHYSVMTGLAVWASASLFFQWMLRTETRPELARWMWAAADVLLLTILLYFAGHPVGPLSLSLALNIGGSGFWFRERLVWFTTFLCMLSYFIQTLIFPPASYPTAFHFLSLIILFFIGHTTASQVQRVRALSRFYEQRRLP